MKNHCRWMRGILFAGAMALLLSCGGGGSGGGGSAGSLGGIAGSGATGSGSDGAGTGGGGTDGSGSSTGGTGSSGGSDGTSTAGNGSDDGSGVGSGGTGVSTADATGIGSGSTGGTGSAGGSDGTSTAGNGSDDGSGVGSGGTGVSTADATGIGSVGGLGSIILNGVRYNTDAAAFSVEDATSASANPAELLQIGMSVRIAGKIDSEFTAATAQQVDSAAELRGAVSAIDAGAGSFAVMGTTVTIDNATIWSGANSLAQIAIGSVVQVWGLPSAPGTLRATRVELKPTSPEPLVTGVVQNLDRIGQRFTLGLLTVRYGSAAFSGGIDLSTLADGAIVRVRGSAAPVADVFTATKVQGWYAVPTQNAAAVQLAGVITNYGGLNAFKVLGTAVDASNAIVTGGPVSSIGDGVKVELDGFMTNGVLVVKKLRIRYIPGTGGPVAFTLIGAIGDYVSPSSFVVKGQKVNASSPATVFENGSAADLANGRRVTVVGNAVVDGVLTAQTVTFLTP